MRVDYGPEDRPGAGAMFVFGLQWAAVILPTVLIMGRVIAGIHFDEEVRQVLYLQKLFFVTGTAILVQVLWGHRLPVIAGPAAVLMIGVIAGGEFGIGAIYTSVAIGGALMALLAAVGVFKYIQKLFTRRVVASVLILIAFTITPTIINMIFKNAAAGSEAARAVFAILFVFAMAGAGRLLPGIWKSALIALSLAVGALVFPLLFPAGEAISSSEHNLVLFNFFFLDLRPQFDFNIGVLTSFLFCYLALAVNDVGSIQSTTEMLEAPGGEKRIKHGMALTGVSGVLSGILGVIGPVNYSMSPGIIMSSGCASRHPLAIAGWMALALSFFPAAIGLGSFVPQPVIGCVLLYILASQMTAGLSIVVQDAGDELSYDTGMKVSLPVLAGTIFSFLPANVIEAFPTIARPIIGNGFVIGVITALLLEHVFMPVREDTIEK